MIFRALSRLAAVLTAVVLSAGPLPQAGASGDEFFEHQWGMRRIGAPEAWPVGRGGGITIAVVDTGVDLGHPDLRANLVGGRDFVDQGSPPRDEHGHGTHVGGTAAAVTGNGIGVAGVAPEARIMPIRVLDEHGSGTLQAVEAGVRYAADSGAEVINLSLGENVVISNLTGGSLASALSYAWDRGAIPVVAAGNDAVFPSGYRGVRGIVVSATGPQDEKPPYSNGVGLATWGMAAPGGNSSLGRSGMILSTHWSEEDGSGYAWAQGTSMAVPHVAGAAAVLRGLGLGQQETVDRLLATARDIGTPGRDPIFGSGLLDLAAAVEGLGASGPQVAGDWEGEPAPAATGSEPQPQATAGPGPHASPEVPAPTVEVTEPLAEESEPEEAPEDVVEGAGEEAVGTTDDEATSGALANTLAAVAILGAAGAVWGAGVLRRRQRA